MRVLDILIYVLLFLLLVGISIAYSEDAYPDNLTEFQTISSGLDTHRLNRSATLVSAVHSCIEDQADELQTHSRVADDRLKSRAPQGLMNLHHLRIARSSEIRPPELWSVIAKMLAQSQATWRKIFTVINKNSGRSCSQVDHGRTIASSLLATSLSITERTPSSKASLLEFSALAFNFAIEDIPQAFAFALPTLEAEGAIFGLQFGYRNLYLWQHGLAPIFEALFTELLLGARPYGFQEIIQ